MAAELEAAGVQVDISSGRLELPGMQPPSPFNADDLEGSSPNEGAGGLRMITTRDSDTENDDDGDEEQMEASAGASDFIACCAPDSVRVRQAFLTLHHTVTKNRHSQSSLNLAPFLRPK